MACDLTLGRLEPCKDSVGGIKAIYFFNFGDANFTVTSNEVTEIDDGTALQAATAYKWDVKGGNGLEQTIVTDRANGTTYFDQVLTLLFKKMDVATTNEIKLLAYGRPHVVIHLNNGDALLVGKEYGTDVTGGTIVTGVAMGDLNGYNLTMTAQEQLPAIGLSGATASDPFAGITTSPIIVEGT